jgi:hypothetical protein
MKHIASSDFFCFPRLRRFCPIGRRTSRDQEWRIRSNAPDWLFADFGNGVRTRGPRFDGAQGPATLRGRAHRSDAGLGAGDAFTCGALRESTITDIRSNVPGTLQILVGVTPKATASGAPLLVLATEGCAKGKLTEPRPVRQSRFVQNCLSGPRLSAAGPGLLPGGRCEGPRPGLLRNLSRS